jgi:hypothetical protein
MKVTIQLGEDARETLSTLSRAYQGLENLSDPTNQQATAQNSDIAYVLDVLNSCLAGAVEALPLAAADDLE